MADVAHHSMVAPSTATKEEYSGLGTVPIIGVDSDFDVALVTINRCTYCLANHSLTPFQIYQAYRSIVTNKTPSGYRILTIGGGKEI